MAFVARARHAVPQRCDASRFLLPIEIAIINGNEGIPFIRTHAARAAGRVICKLGVPGAVFKFNRAKAKIRKRHVEGIAFSDSASVKRLKLVGNAAV